MFDFEVKIAQNESELKQAMRLRYEIFTQHIDTGLRQIGSEQLDTDEYDEFCDHLIVIDKTNNKIIGTYRLLLGSKVNKRIGFYAEKFFNIDNIKKLDIDGQMLELGRSCIHHDYRDRLVINLLWSGISKYIKYHNVKLVFGSVTLGTKSTTSASEISRVFKFIKKKFYASREYRVYPKSTNLFKGIDENVKLKTYDDIWRNLPPLVKGYLRAGVVACGPPAINPDFDSILLFILLDIKKISLSYKRHFF